MKRVRIVGLALLISGAAFGQSQTFSAGAIIIPEQANLQTACGVASAYGLIYQLLRANGPGGALNGTPVTVYVAVNNLKTSVGTCVPSNLNTTPAGSLWNDPLWNTGCDIQIHNAVATPVTQLPSPLVAPPMSGIYPDNTLSWIQPNKTDATIASYYSNPGLSTGSGFTDMQYLGGPFIIDKPDVPNFINWLLTTADPNVKQFTQPCTCNGGGANSAQIADGTCFFVNMHQAKVNFVANVAARFNKIPPHIALLDVETANSVQDAGGPTTGLSTGILDNYLQFAGLNFAGAGGCPPQGGGAGQTFSNACQGYFGAGTWPARGVMYDVIDANADLISTAANKYGVLNAKDSSGLALYGVLWTPHWEAGDTAYTQYAPNGDGSGFQLQNVLNNIAHFVGQQGNGLLGECAAIGSYQGVNASSSYKSPLASTQSEFMINGMINANGANPTAYDGTDCTIPAGGGVFAGGQCAVFPNPSNLISQIGDYHYWGCSGVTENISVSAASGPGSAYQPGALRLAVAWQDSVAPGFVPPIGLPPDGNHGWDFFDTGAAGDAGQVVFIGGHRYDGSGSCPGSHVMAGLRVILNSLLELGAEPTGPERALAAPVVYDPNDGGRALLVAGTYNAVVYPPTPVVNAFKFENGSNFIFPMLPGHLRATPLNGVGALATGETDFGATAAIFDAQAVMGLSSPESRNIFTYFGGNVQAAGAGVDGVLQQSWAPEIVSGDAGFGGCSAGAAPCVDVLQLSRGGGAPNYPTLTLGSDGICDILESVAVFDVASLNGGNDYGGNCNAHDIKVIIQNLPKAESMLQEVRGYCFATSSHADGVLSATNYPLLNPTNAQCNATGARDVPELGGIAHSSPAVIPPSPNVLDKCSAGTQCRPVVAYVGGLDGQLHAFFVQGGSGYGGPLAGRGSCLTTPGDGGIHYPNCSANAPRPAGAIPANVFGNDYSAVFATGGTLPAAGTELWSFIPPSQLPGLQENNARVDSSPAVMDVFVDMLGTGVREWHTVVVASIGPTGNEVLAMDVTDPFYPVLLWDIIGTQLPWGAGDPIYTPAQMTDATTPAGTVQRIKWEEPSALFALTGADPGRLSTNLLYNYADMGASSHVSMGQLRAGLEPVYAAFVATNGAVGPSMLPGEIELFAVDIATGQKLWQWEKPYSVALGAQNAVPPVASLLPGVNGAVSRVFVGDQEGKVWELDANTGINVNNDNGDPSCASPPCNYAAFDVGSTAVTPQPISTNIGIARVPPNPTGVLGPYASTDVLAFGTGGEDWVPATAPGDLHVVAWDPKFRSALTNVAADETSGVLPEIPSFPISLAGPEHLYGAITVSGNSVFFSSAKDIIGNDLSKVVGTTGGATYQVNLSTAAAGALDSQFAVSTVANFGGLAVYHNAASGKDYLLGMEVGKVANMQITSGGTPSSQQSLNSRGILYQLLSWMARFGL